MRSLLQRVLALSLVLAVVGGGLGVASAVSVVPGQTATPGSILPLKIPGKLIDSAKLLPGTGAGTTGSTAFSLSQSVYGTLLRGSTSAYQNLSFEYIIAPAQPVGADATTSAGTIQLTGFSLFYRLPAGPITTVPYATNIFTINNANTRLPDQVTRSADGNTLTFHIPAASASSLSLPISPIVVETDVANFAQDGTLTLNGVFTAGGAYTVSGQLHPQASGSPPPLATPEPSPALLIPLGIGALAIRMRRALR